MKKIENMQKCNRDRKGGILFGSVILSSLFFLVLQRFIPVEYEPIIKASEIIFSAVTLIVGLWISCYLLCVELFKDRYPMEILKKEYTVNVKWIFFALIYCMVYGGIVVICDFIFWGCVWFIIMSTFTIIYVFFCIYQANNALMCNTYIDEYYEKIKNNVEKRDIVDFPNALKEMKQIFAESIEKEESYVARNIVEKIGKIFRMLLSNCIRLREEVDKEKIQDAFDQIVDFNIFQLSTCQDSKSSLLLMQIIRQQRVNLTFCIDNDQFEWYKQYLFKCNKFLFKMQKEENTVLEEKIYSIYHHIAKKLVEFNKIEWLIHTISEIESLTLYVYSDQC